MSINLLTANQASVETDLTGLLVWVGCTLSRTTTGATHGTNALLITTTATTGASASTPYTASPYAPTVTPEQTYTASATVTPVTGTRDAKMGIVWYSAAFANLDYSTPPSFQSISAGTVLRVTGTAPAGTVYACVQVVLDAGSAAGNAVAVDQIGLWEGAGGVWEMPTFSGPVGTALWPRDVQYQLNRLAKTLVNDRPQLSEQAAANKWAATPGGNWDLQGALNFKAGILNPKDYYGVRWACNQIAGTTNQDPASALSTIATPA